MDTARQAREWIACADAYWAAARHLPEDESAFTLPRLRLASLALEYRLRTFICVVRGGMPEGDDLGRLARLATFCGLRIDADDHAIIERLSRLHRDDPDTAGVPPMPSIGALLSRIAAQSRLPAAGP